MCVLVRIPQPCFIDGRWCGSQEITAEKLDEDLDSYFSQKKPSKAATAATEAVPADDEIADAAGDVVDEVLEDME
jgi:hypothetical protein